ncbi:stage II sporulation protein M [Candidatus Woesearchaeota archaeon]|nr:stage II sporulation protein M [Candidatus Woesearchaeota archaeon]
MVLEALFNPFTVKKKPWQMFGAGFLYTIIALAMSYVVFTEIAGILMIFLIVIATLPILYSTIKGEEELDMQIKKESILLKEHTKVLVFLMFLFLGITSAFVLSYIFLPTAMVDSIFSLQQNAINSVNVNINTDVTGNITKIDLFSRIFVNNLKVLFFCLIFSLLYGTGAIFILTWNASVIATAIGNLVKVKIAESLGGLTSYFSVAVFSFMRYMTHGVFEIMAYFIAGLAGGIISIALIKHNMEERSVLVDALDLVLISLGLIIVAGVVEVYVTPLFF